MKIYVKNLESATIRLENFKKETQNIKYEIKKYTPMSINNSELLNLYSKTRYASTNSEKKKRELSIRLTTRDILLEAKKNKYKQVLILEDDIYIKPGIDVNLYLDKISELPEDFALCYLGCYFPKAKPQKFFLLKYNDYFVEMKGNPSIWGSHAIVFNHTIYDEVIDVYSKEIEFTSDGTLYRKVIPFNKTFISNPLFIFQKYIEKDVCLHNRIFNFERLEEETFSLIDTKLKNLN